MRAYYVYFAFCVLKYYDAFKVGRAKRIAWYVEFGCNNGFIQLDVYSASSNALILL